MFDWLRRSPPPPPPEEQLKLTRALAGYPPYAPPEYGPAPNPESMREASFRYRDYFLANRQARLEALREFFANFDVCLSLDDAGLMAVSSWLPYWADLLVDDFDDKAVRDGYDLLRVPWTGTLIGLNVIFDLGVYYAECLWSRRTKLEWSVTRGADVHGIVRATHFVKGLPGGKWFDPIHFMYSECWNIRKAKIAKQQRLPHSDDPWLLKSESFYRHVLAKTPSGRRSRKSK
jgi:hypothetical protein